MTPLVYMKPTSTDCQEVVEYFHRMGAGVGIKDVSESHENYEEAYRIFSGEFPDQPLRLPITVIDDRYLFGVAAVYAHMENLKFGS